LLHSFLDASAGKPPADVCVVAVVVNWNGWADTIECVESVLRSSQPPSRIVVVDNGSLDDSMRRLEAWADGNAIESVCFASPVHAMAGSSSSPLVFIQSDRNLGYAGGNNVGMSYAVERAGADFVWILNNDVVVDERALERAMDLALGDPAIGIVGAQLLRYDEPEIVQALGGGYILPILCHDTQLRAGKKAVRGRAQPIEVDHLIGASLLVRAEAARQAGPIDESYFLYREETDWCLQMRRRGWKLCCCPGSIVWHKQSRSIGFKSPLHDYYAVRNVLRLTKKFYPAYLPTAFVYFACRSLLPKLVRFEYERAAAVCAALRDFLKGVEGRAPHHSDATLRHAYIDNAAAAAPGARTHLRRALPAAALLLVALAALVAVRVFAALPTQAFWHPHGRRSAAAMAIAKSAPHARSSILRPGVLHGLACAPNVRAVFDLTRAAASRAICRFRDETSRTIAIGLLAAPMRN
jgi:GT2 family glycosyltransferase